MYSVLSGYFYAAEIITIKLFPAYSYIQVPDLSEEQMKKKHFEIVINESV